MLRPLRWLRYAMRKLLSRIIERWNRPRYDELLETMSALTELVEHQQSIVDAAEDLVEAMWLLDPKGNPAISIKCDNPADAHTIRHRIWELQCLIVGDEPPAPIFIEGTYH